MTTSNSMGSRSTSIRWHHALALAAMMALSAGTASAATVTYVATDLADTTVGEDLWQYDYVVNGPMLSFESFNLLYSQDRYADLNWLSSSSSDLDLAPLVQPDTGLLTPGIARLTALNDLAASFSGQVSLSFVWKVTGSNPGEQPLEFIDANGGPMGESTTLPNVPAIPEPSTVALTLGGLGLLAWRRRSATKATV